MKNKRSIYLVLLGVALFTLIGTATILAINSTNDGTAVVEPEQVSPNTVGKAVAEVSIDGFKIITIENLDDTDGDGILDVEDDDLDNDGYINTKDVYPFDADHKRASETKNFIKDIEIQVSTRKMSLSDGVAQLQGRMYDSNQNFMQYALGAYALVYVNGDMQDAVDNYLIPLLERNLNTNERYEVVSRAASAYDSLGQYSKAKEMAIEAIKLNPTNFVKANNDHWIEFYKRMKDLEEDK